MPSPSYPWNGAEEPGHGQGGGRRAGDVGWQPWEGKTGTGGCHLLLLAVAGWLLPPCRFFCSTSTTFPCSFSRMVLASTSYRGKVAKGKHHILGSAPKITSARGELPYPTNPTALRIPQPREGAQDGVLVPCPTRDPPGPPAHLEDVVEVLLVHPQEVAVVLPQDDAGRPGRVVHQRQLPKIVPLVQGGHQTLRGDRDGVKTPVPCSGWGMQGVWRAPRLGTRWYRGQGGRAGTHTPCRG